jgi:hypothetical protein
MAFSQGSRSGLSYIKEVTFGTTPVGNFTALPFSTHSLSLTKDRVEGTDIRSDRMTRVDRHGNKNTGGDVVSDLRATDFDTLLEAALFSTWDSSPAAAPDILKVGTTFQSFSIEDAAEDISQYQLFNGMSVSSMAISIAPNQMVKTTLQFVGSGMDLSNTGKTLVAASGEAPFDSYSGGIALGNVASATAVGTVTSVDFTLDNGMNPTFVVGSDITPQMEFGRAKVEGTMVVYFEDDDIMNRFINETESELTVGVNDPTGANLYTFGFPRIKINSANVPVAGEASRMVTCEFVALYDSTTDTNFYIERTDST